MTVVHLWICDHCESPQDGGIDVLPNGWLQTAKGDYCRQSCAEEALAVRADVMNRERCPGCGLDLAIGERELYDGLCRLCAARKAADVPTPPSGDQGRLGEA
jgi:hypothetical protein